MVLSIDVRPHPVTISCSVGPMSEMLLRKHAGRMLSPNGIGLDTRTNAMSSYRRLGR